MIGKCSLNKSILYMYKKRMTDFVVFLSCIVVLSVTAACGDKRTYAEINRIDSIAVKSPQVAVGMADSMMRADSAEMSTREQMKLRLGRGRARNSAGIPLGSEQEIRAVAEYFEKHGTDNERMSAYYVLGSVYRDREDYPQALESYYKALSFGSVNNPDSAECVLLNRIHGQMGFVLYQQLALEEARSEYLKAKHFAYLAKDTITALLAFEQIANIYVFENKRLAEYELRKYLCNSYMRRCMMREASKALAPAAETMLLTGRIDEAGRALNMYEKYSNDFDRYGNIFDGGEYYYPVRGRYYVRIGDQDKAGLFLEKGLHSTTSDDFSTRKALYIGMAELFKLRNIPDSVVKYSELARLANDSMYSQMSMSRMQQLHAAYTAKAKEREYFESKNRELKYRIALVCTLSVLMLCVLVSLFVHYRTKAKRCIEQQKLQAYIDDMKKASVAHRNMILGLQRKKEELEILNRSQSSEIASLLIEKKRHIDEEMAKHKEEDSRMNTSKEEIVRHFKELANIMRQRAEKEDWDNLDAFIADCLTPLYSLKPLMSKLEYEITVLVYLGLGPSEISVVTGNSPSNISNVRKRLYKKIKGKEGSARDYDEYVKTLI